MPINPNPHPETFRHASDMASHLANYHLTGNREHYNNALKSRQELLNLRNKDYHSMLMANHATRLGNYLGSLPKHEIDEFKSNGIDAKNLAQGYLEAVHHISKMPKNKNFNLDFKDWSPHALQIGRNRLGSERGGQLLARTIHRIHGDNAYTRRMASEFRRGYVNARLARYDPNRDKFYHDQNIENVTNKPTKDVTVSESRGWHHRIVPGVNGELKHHLSLNVVAHPGLIRDLDSFITKHKGVGQYKTPSQSESWLDRHDPVSLYLTRNLNQEEGNELRGIVDKYRRSDKGLIGQQIHPGMHYLEEPTGESTMATMKNAFSAHPQMGNALHNVSTFSGGRFKPSLSAGETYVANNVMNNPANKPTQEELNDMSKGNINIVG